MLESRFQTDLIEDLRGVFPDCVILKNDANYLQGFPDLLVLWEDKWAALEVKASPTARLRPNQEYFVNRLDAMSFAAFVFPENKEEVLRALQSAFGSSRPSRFPERQ